MRLTVYRHGEILLPNNEKRFAGRTDYPLSEAGKEQIRRMAAVYEGNPERIYASSSLRCRESGEIFREILQNTELVLRDDLREIDMGEWDGKTFAEIKGKHPHEYAERGKDLPGYRVPGGETFAELQQRAVCAVKDIASQTNSEAILITHLGVIRTLRCYLYHIPLSQMMAWTLDYGQCFLLDGSQ